MKVVLINGSPRPEGNTAAALAAAAGSLNEAGVETEKIEVGGALIHGCVSCFACGRKGAGRCLKFTDDPVNDWIEIMAAADGFIIGSPVYYSGINGTLKSFLDRSFFAAASGGAGRFRHKVGGAVTGVRRAGSLTALDQIFKYFSITEMFIASGNYWTQVYGMAPGEAAGDEEGLQAVKLMAANMAWLLKLMAHGRPDVPPPAPEAKIITNFIR